MKCTAYCVAASLQFQQLIQHLQDNLTHVTAFREAAFFECPGAGRAVIFSYGAVVFWATQETQVQQLLSTIREFAVDPIDHPPVDHFSFSIASQFKMADDQIILDSADPLVMLALSHALAQSVKLEFFETRVQQAVKSAQQLVDELSQKGRIHLSRREIARRIGWLMQQRYSINLHCDVLDTPDFFWDSSELEKYYQASIAYLDLSQRVTVLYRRLDTASEIFEILTTEINHRHSSFLEWIIIFLILLEVMMSIAIHWSPW